MEDVLMGIEDTLSRMAPKDTWLSLGQNFGQHGSVKVYRAEAPVFIGGYIVLAITEIGTNDRKVDTGAIHAKDALEATLFAAECFANFDKAMAEIETRNRDSNDEIPF